MNADPREFGRLLCLLVDRSISIRFEGERMLCEAEMAFIMFLLSDFVARYDYAHPLERIFHDILGTISFDYSLSIHERRVLGLQLQGKSYKSIAARLHISQSMVRKHLTSIHGKTGTSSTAALCLVLWLGILSEAQAQPFAWQRCDTCYRNYSYSFGTDSLFLLGAIGIPDNLATPLDREHMRAIC